ncbi:hypothetical protein PInf_008496 [Phytophthora infestans]|nr:hypothetical protein PInf_008496 [Phytophthora infestans]
MAPHRRPDDSLAPGAVLPGGETPTADAATENFNSPMQWEASSSGFVPVTAPISTASPSSATQEGSDTTQNSTSTSEHAPFGKVTSKPGECVIGNPDKYVSAADISWIWENRIGPDAPKRNANWNVMENKNWIMDRIVKNKGTLNYCVRWDSTEKLSKTVASKFQAMLERQYAAWSRWLIGYGCWPYNEIKINMVGFAVKDASLLYDVGIQNWSDTKGCENEPFDLSLWPKQGLEGGFGYDWGQGVNLENMVQNIDEEILHIVAHEIGSSVTITDVDGWMLRNTLEKLKPRYAF